MYDLDFAVYSQLEGEIGNIPELKSTWDKAGS